MNIALNQELTSGLQTAADQENITPTAAAKRILKEALHQQGHLPPATGAPHPPPRHNPDPMDPTHRPPQQRPTIRNAPTAPHRRPHSKPHTRPESHLQKPHPQTHHPPNPTRPQPKHPNPSPHLGKTMGTHRHRPHPHRLLQPQKNSQKQTLRAANTVLGILPKPAQTGHVSLARRSRAWKGAQDTLREHGYRTHEVTLNAGLCGVPQRRRRLFGIAWRGEAGRGDELENFYADNMADEELSVSEYLSGELGIEHYYRHPRSYARRGVFSASEPSPTIRGVNRTVPPSVPRAPSGHCTCLRGPLPHDSGAGQDTDLSQKLGVGSPTPENRHGTIGRQRRARQTGALCGRGD